MKLGNLLEQLFAGGIGQISDNTKGAWHIDINIKAERLQKNALDLAVQLHSEVEKTVIPPLDIRTMIPKTVLPKDITKITET